MEVYVYDNGICNIKSMVSAIRFLGGNPKITKDCKVRNNVKHLVLPGVGSFDSAMSQMRKTSADSRIQEFADGGGHILGVCLGMQLLFEQGFEGGQTSGLGLLQGSVQHLPAPDKGAGETLPNMGWHYVDTTADTLLTESGADVAPCYFVHSYHCIPDDDDIIKMKISYGNQDICVGVVSDQIYGVQFHPEKSGEPGLDMLKRFMTL